MTANDDRIVDLDIAKRILIIRGQRVLLDQDLAALYGVTVKRLNQQVRRNWGKFPADFLLEVSEGEATNLRIHFASSSWGGRRSAYFAFTEHGAIMAATILSNESAMAMTVYVVRAFVKLRDILASNSELAQKLALLERSLTSLDARTRKQFDDVYAAIRALTASPATQSRPIGFTADLDKKR